MQHLKKDEYLKLLRDNESFKSALSRTTDEKERRAIKAYTEDFFMNFYNNVFSPLARILEEDPEAINKAVLEIKNELINSGSTGVK